ncbi:hypothetical protein MXD62_26940 [Frankia sp. Mgl5]|nr:hypothetical protein [Frankia sp. Mgl5]
MIALTFLPALLGFAGRRVFGRKARRNPVSVREAAEERAGARWARFVLRHPTAVLLTGAVVLAVIAIPLASIQMALPDDGHLPTGTTQRRAYDLLTAGFGAGFNGPLLVTVDGSRAPDPRGAAADSVRAIWALPDVASVSTPSFNAGGNTAMIKLVPKAGPNDTATHDLVAAIRRSSDRLESATGAELLVTGRTALNIDISQRLRAALIPYLAVVVGLAFCC